MSDDYTSIRAVTMQPVRDRREAVPNPVAYVCPSCGPCTQAQCPACGLILLPDDWQVSNCAGCLRLLLAHTQKPGFGRGMLAAERKALPMRIYRYRDERPYCERCYADAAEI